MLDPLQVIPLLAHRTARAIEQTIAWLDRLPIMCDRKSVWIRYLVSFFYGKPVAVGRNDADGSPGDDRRPHSSTNLNCSRIVRCSEGSWLI